MNDKIIISYKETGNNISRIIKNNDSVDISKANTFNMKVVNKWKAGLSIPNIKQLIEFCNLYKADINQIYSIEDWFIIINQYGIISMLITSSLINI